MRRAHRLIPLIALAVPALSVGGCGGKTPEPTTPTPAASASATGKAVDATPPPPPSALPAMQPMPPPGVRGSDAAKVEEIDALYTCQASVAGASAGKEPKAEAAKRAAACAKVSGSWTKVLAQAVTQADGDAAAKIPFRAEAARCYRVYTAHDTAVTALNVTVRDAAGKDALDDGGPALPRAGRLCFSAAGDATLLVAVGAGRGTVAVELWSTAK